MNKPPKEIDGALVIEWAWSGERPFGVVHYSSGDIASEIYGLAICRYINDNKVYRFSCDENWETEQDADYDSLEEAKVNLPAQYQNIKVNWQRY